MSRERVKTVVISGRSLKSVGWSRVALQTVRLGAKTSSSLPDVVATEAPSVSQKVTVRGAARSRDLMSLRGVRVRALTDCTCSWNLLMAKADLSA